MFADICLQMVYSAFCQIRNISCVTSQNPNHWFLSDRSRINKSLSNLESIYLPFTALQNHPAIMLKIKAFLTSTS